MAFASFVMVLGQVERKGLFEWIDIFNSPDPYLSRPTIILLDFISFLSNSAAESLLNKDPKLIGCY